MHLDSKGQVHRHLTSAGYAHALCANQNHAPHCCYIFLYFNYCAYSTRSCREVSARLSLSLLRVLDLPLQVSRDAPKISRNVLTVCSKLPKDYPCQVWGKNVRSGARYGCECNVLRDGEIRCIPT